MKVKQIKKQNEICKYGCERLAKYKIGKNKTFCCEDDFRKCPSFIKRRSSKLIGRKYSQEHCEKIRKSSLGKKIKRETILKANETRRKYNINSRYFQNIDSSDKCYWIGFFLADGTIVNNNISLSLKKEDKNHIYKFRNSIGSNHPIKLIKDNRQKKDGTTQDTYKINFSNFLMREDLNNLGIVQNKTFKESMPVGIQEQYERDFWRGMIDGDGCLFYFKQYNIKRLGIYLCGSKQICECFKQYCSKILNKNVKSSVRKISYTNLFKIEFRGQHDVKILVENLYMNSNLYLDRKYNLFKEFMQHEN